MQLDITDNESEYEKCMQNFEREILDLYEKMKNVPGQEDVDYLDATEAYFDSKNLDPDNYVFSEAFVDFLKQDAIRRNLYIETKEEIQLRKRIKKPLDLM